MAQENYTAENLQNYFPHIKYVEGEDLNLERNTVKILRKCWKDVNRFRTISDIAKATSMSERTIHKYAKTYGLDKRSTIR
jgi:DNA-binding phage protein